MYRRIGLLWLSALTLAGCQLFGGVRVDAVATSAQRPSNVAVYLSAAKGDSALRGITAQSFTLYEDGQELSREQTRQTLLPRDLVAVHRALLLVDMSGATDEKARTRVSEAAARFVTAARHAQPVTVYAFDGGARIRRIEDFPMGDEAVEEIAGLAQYASGDPSSNLFSAVVEALKQLDTLLMTTAKPIRIGTLAVFLQGPDLAGRVEESAMREAVRDTPHHVLAIDVQESEYSGRRIEKDGGFTATSLAGLNSAFTEAGQRARELTEQYYLLAYCSPARAGQRHLKVEVTTTDAEGNESRGRTTTEFDATGFTAGCNPETTPRFVVRAAPRQEEDSQPEPEPEPEPTAPPAKRTPPKPASRSGSSASPPPPKEDDSIVPPPETPDYAQ